MSQTPYELLGEEGVRALATRFYQVMAEEPAAHRIRNMHQGDLGSVTEKLAQFLRGWLGGPRDYFERADAPCIMSLHKRLPIGAEEARQWTACMERALEDVAVTEEVRGMLRPAFARMAEAMRSS
ncbi:MAG: group II truncated hemoglobin [Hyphomonadaceae bacterium]|nr:group II truncated hemoglobin [Hyphomonadaceae bacterium]